MLARVASSYVRSYSGIKCHIGGRILYNSSVAFSWIYRNSPCYFRRFWDLGGIFRNPNNFKKYFLGYLTLQFGLYLCNDLTDILFPSDKI